MTDQRPPEICCECEAETGRAGKLEDSLYIEMQKGDRGPLCESCFDKWTAIVGRVYIRFDGPPAHESGRFIEVERDGASISFGIWFQDGDDWLLVLPDGAQYLTTGASMSDRSKLLEARLDAALPEWNRLLPGIADILQRYRAWLDANDVPAEDESGWPSVEAIDQENVTAFARENSAYVPGSDGR